MRVTHFADPPFMHSITLVRLARLVPFLAMLAAAGCATGTGPARLSAAQLADPARGVVLLSTGARERCSSQAMWAPILDGRTFEFQSALPIVPIDANSNSDFPDHYGTLSALSLPPGHYAISLLYANPVSETNVSPGYAFDVVAGRTLYLGELYRDSPCGARALFAVRDQYDRDVALAGRANPDFARRAPERMLLEPLGPIPLR